MAAPKHPVARRPISFDHRSPRKPPNERPLRGAWVLLLVFGLPLALMGVLTTLARAGIVIDLFSPLWQPWPPDVLKPFIGFGGFAATLAYLTYCAGHRSGFRSGLGVGIASTRTWVEAHAPPPESVKAESTPLEIPPPPSPITESPVEPEPAPPPPA